MPEIISPVLGLDTQTALAAASMIFDDSRIIWRVANYNAGTLEMDLLGVVVDSENKVLVKIGPRSVVAVYQDRNGQTILESRSLGSVGAACSDLKARISGDNRPFSN